MFKILEEVSLLKKLLFEGLFVFGLTCDQWCVFAHQRLVQTHHLGRKKPGLHWRGVGLHICKAKGASGADWQRDDGSASLPQGLKQPAERTGNWSCGAEVSVRPPVTGRGYVSAPINWETELKVGETTPSNCAYRNMTNEVCSGSSVSTCHLCHSVFAQQIATDTKTSRSGRTGDRHAARWTPTNSHHSSNFLRFIFSNAAEGGSLKSERPKTLVSLLNSFICQQICSILHLEMQLNLPLLNILSIKTVVESFHWLNDIKTHLVVTD